MRAVKERIQTTLLKRLATISKDTYDIFSQISKPGKTKVSIKLRMDEVGLVI